VKEKGSMRGNKTRKEQKNGRNKMKRSKEAT
jgi:hypothetical protein